MMTSDDINTIMDLLIAAYGEKSYPIDDPKKMAKISNLWSVMFADDNPAEVLIAVKDCIATLQFLPKIADIKQRISANRLAGQMTEMEAWAIIRDAVERSTSREEAQKIYDRLPKIIQRTVGSASQLRGWRIVDDDQFETVVASNCMRTYKMLAQREAGYHALPTDIQQEEQWRIEKPKQAELPEPEKPKKVAYEKPEWMIRREEAERERKNQQKSDDDEPDMLSMELL